MDYLNYIDGNFDDSELKNSSIWHLVLFSQSFLLSTQPSQEGKMEKWEKDRAHEQHLRMCSNTAFWYCTDVVS